MSKEISHENLKNVGCKKNKDFVMVLRAVKNHEFSQFQKIRLSPPEHFSAENYNEFIENPWTQIVLTEFEVSIYHLNMINCLKKSKANYIQFIKYCYDSKKLLKILGEKKHIDLIYQTITRLKIKFKI